MLENNLRETPTTNMSFMDFSSIRRTLIASSLCFVLLPCTYAHAQDCGEITTTQGPFDYRTANIVTLRMVESYHFTPDVERLIRGSTALTPAGDMEFALRIFPNHPRVLLAMINYAEKTKSDRPPGANYPVGCWLERAEQFAPDDGKVELLYGIYLSRKGNPQGAVAKLSRAGELLGEDANVHYDLGLAYFDLRDYDKALLHAQAAYSLGFPLPGLRNKLQSVGKWRPAAPSPPPASAPSAAPPGPPAPAAVPPSAN